MTLYARLLGYCLARWAYSLMWDGPHARRRPYSCRVCGIEMGATAHQRPFCAWANRCMTRLGYNPSRGGWRGWLEYQRGGAS